MNRRQFLAATASCAALPSLSFAAANEDDERIRREIDAHRPSRLARLPGDFKARVGATHVAGKYHFTDKPFLIEGAEKLIELGTRLGKFWFMPHGAAHDYPFNSNWPKTKGFVDLATTDYWEQVFALPFATIILEAHAPIESGWMGAGSQAFHDEVMREFFELTTHFYKKFVDREVTVILQHWEGDWMLRGKPGAKWETPPEDWPRRCEQMAKWLAARQAGVSKARKEFLAGRPPRLPESNQVETRIARPSHEVKCRVVHATEVNRVLDGWKNIPTVTSKVLPHIELDLVSYSYYDAMSSAVTLWKAIEEIRKNARTSGPFGAQAVYLGEVGIPENEQPKNLRDRWDEFLGVMLAMHIPCLAHWEIFCNEPNPKLTPAPGPPVKNNDDVRGFFLVKPDGTLSESGKFLRELWQRG
jgi:hypothetical protein